jgi:hypothetical protein
MRPLDQAAAREAMIRAGVLPLEAYKGSSAKWRCKCLTCGKTVFPAHSSIKQNPGSRGCNFCAKQATQDVLRARNYQKATLFFKDSELRILGSYVNAKTRSTFICTRCDAEFETTYSDLQSGRKTCRCKKKPRNSLAVSYPELAKELHPTANGFKTASTIGSGMRSNVWWICKNNHEFEASPANRVRGSACRFCAGMEAYSGESDLATLFPELCLELATDKERLKAEKTRPGSPQKLIWQCKKNILHIYEMSAFDRTSNGSGCSYCAGKRVLAGDNDFASNYPEQALEWDYAANYPARPETTAKASNLKFAWVCGFNSTHKWLASPNDRRSRGCLQCSRFQIGRNDLATKAEQSGRGHLVREWADDLNGITASMVSYSSNDQAFWRCSKYPSKHVYQAKVSNRWFGNTGCPTCSPSAYDANSAGILYFIENPKLGARKIGITNRDAKHKRLEKFLSQGWQNIAAFEHENGLIIRRIEEVILRRIREEFKLPQFLDQSAMRGMAGATETFSIDGISNGALIAELEYEFARSKSKLDVARLDSLLLT